MEKAQGKKLDQQNVHTLLNIIEGAVWHLSYR